MRRKLHNALGVFFLHKWAFFVPACLMASAAFLVSLYYPRKYSATTTFERRNDPVMFDLPLSAGATASFNYFRTTMHTDLTSVSTMVEVIDNLGLTKTLPRDTEGNFTAEGIQQRNNLARSLGGMLSVGRSSPNEQLDIIAITYTGTDASIGKRLVEEVKKVYIRRTMAWTREFLERQRDYFLHEADAALDELKAAQRDETQLRLQNPLVNPGDPSALPAKITQLELERRELQMRRREYEAELTANKQTLASLAPEDVIGSDAATPESPDDRLPSAEAVRLQAKRLELNNKVSELRATRGMTDEHPDIKERLVEIRRIESAIEIERNKPQSAEDQADRRAARAALARSLVPADHPLIAERARLRAQIEAQEVKIADLDVSLKSNEMGVSELLKAKEHLFEHQEEYNDVLTRVAQAKHKVSQLDATLMSIEPAINAISQDRLLQFSDGQSARGSSIPVYPKSQTVLLLAGLAGFLAGAVGLILSEILDHVYRSSSQVARSLGLPILEAIDEIVTAKDRRRRMIRRMVVAPLCTLGLLGATGISGSLAYLSLNQPWTYQRLRQMPRAAAEYLGIASTEMGSPSLGPISLGGRQTLPRGDVSEVPQDDTALQLVNRAPNDGALSDVNGS